MLNVIISVLRLFAQSNALERSHPLLFARLEFII
jgi:hypothetical protein